MIEDILELMYLVEGRNATKVDVGVKRMDWNLKKKNVVIVIIGDNVEGMSSRDMNESFDLKIKDFVLLQKHRRSS